VDDGRIRFAKLFNIEPPFCKKRPWTDRHEQNLEPARIAEAFGVAPEFSSWLVFKRSWPLGVRYWAASAATVSITAPRRKAVGSGVQIRAQQIALLEEQSKSRLDEPQRHQRQPGTNPGKKGALCRQEIPRAGLEFFPRFQGISFLALSYRFAPLSLRVVHFSNK